MPVTKEQAQMLTSLAIACRPHRAPTWDEAGIMAQLAKVRDWSLSEVALRVIVCAADREAKTPAVITAPGTRIPETKPPPFAPNTWDANEVCSDCSQTRTACESRPRFGDDDHAFVSRARNAADTARPFEAVQLVVADLHERVTPETPTNQAPSAHEEASHG